MLGKGKVMVAIPFSLVGGLDPVYCRKFQSSISSRHFLLLPTPSLSSLSFFCFSFSFLLLHGKKKKKIFTNTTSPCELARTLAALAEPRGNSVVFADLCVILRTFADPCGLSWTLVDSRGLSRILADPRTLVDPREALPSRTLALVNPRPREPSPS
jgi:hypothetical protein